MSYTFLQVILIFSLLYVLYYLVIWIFYSKNKLSKIARSYYNALDYNRYKINTSGTLRELFINDFYANSLYLTGLEKETYEINKNWVFTYNFNTTTLEDLNTVLWLFLYTKLVAKYNLENIVIDPIERRVVEQDELKERILNNYKQSTYIYWYFLASKIKQWAELEYLEEVYWEIWK